MSRGRKANLDPPKEWKVSIPESVALEVEFRLMNPLTDKPAHGARARLITQLLREWLTGRSNS